MEDNMRTLAASLLAFAMAFPAIAENAPAVPGTAEISSVPVYNEQNEKLGEASEVIVDPRGEVKGMVVKVSDAATTPTEVVVPLDRVKVASGEKKVVVAATKDELKAMPKPQDAPNTRAGGI
jgi:sporulation protein YlmC with PRC-barrel domain